MAGSGCVELLQHGSCSETPVPCQRIGLLVDEHGTPTYTRGTIEDLRDADYVEIVLVAIATQSNNSRVYRDPGGLVLARTARTSRRNTPRGRTRSSWSIVRISRRWPSAVSRRLVKYKGACERQSHASMIVTDANVWHPSFCRTIASI